LAATDNADYLSERCEMRAMHARPTGRESGDPLSDHVGISFPAIPGLKPGALPRTGLRRKGRW